MMKTRSQRKLEDDEETVAKHSKTEEDDLAKALKESLDDVLASLPPSTSKTDESSVTKKDPESFTTIFQKMKCQGLSLPKFYKTLRKVAELVESDDVEGSMMMMLYLHHHNPDSKHFMEKVFTDQRIVDIIRNHFVLWAADMSKEDDRAKVEQEVKQELSKEVVDLLRQYQVEDYPLLMVVMLLDGQHQVMKVFSGIQDIPTLCQGLAETIFTLRSVMEEEEGGDDEDVVEEDATPSPTSVTVYLQVGPCIHTAQFNPLQKLEDLFQYVACRIGLKIGQFSLSSAPGTDLTILWDILTLQQVGMEGGSMVKLTVARK